MKETNETNEQVASRMLYCRRREGATSDHVCSARTSVPSSFVTCKCFCSVSVLGCPALHGYPYLPASKYLLQLQPPNAPQICPRTEGGKGSTLRGRHGAEAERTRPSQVWRTSWKTEWSPGSQAEPKRGDGNAGGRLAELGKVPVGVEDPRSGAKSSGPASSDLMHLGECVGEEACVGETTLVCL